jgi:tRNA dimethylallyltransferase
MPVPMRALTTPRYSRQTDRSTALVPIRTATHAHAGRRARAPAILPCVAAPTVIALFGPTGIGKTAVALALARRLRAAGEDPVAISADALQVYAGLEILTGAADAAERGALEHRLLSFLPVDATFSAGQYAELAHAEIDGALAAGRRPIVVGGTGLYLRAALTELRLRPPPPEGVRERWTGELERIGAPALHARLAQRAAWAAEAIDPNDRQRIVRAHELLDAGELEPPEGPSQLWTDEVRRPTLLAGLVMEREALYARIDARVDEMVAAGAREEVLAAHAAGASETARKALGFDDLLAGDVEAMKRRTRNYARRQLTWMRKLAGVRTIDVTGRAPDDVAAEIVAAA